MKAKLIAAGALLLSHSLIYQIAWERSTARHQNEATLAAQKVEEAVARASDAIRHLTQTVETFERTDEQAFREIEDEANADGVHCVVPAGRLRKLDTIAN